jgi:hypothetical protein
LFCTYTECARLVKACKYFHCNLHSGSFIRSFLRVWLALWLVLTYFCWPETKTVCLASFLARKKDPLLDGTFLRQKNPKTPISLSLKSQRAEIFFLCVSMYLMQTLAKFHCLSLNTFFLQGFKGPHQVQNSLSEVPEEPDGIQAQETGGNHQEGGVQN